MFSLVTLVLAQTCQGDWLVRPMTERATAERSADGKEIVLANGLIRRTFRLRPNVATVAYDNLMTGASILRGVKPEAVVQIDGAIFDNSPCLCSAWGRQYFQRLRTFVEHTGLDILENDGSYPGDVCASTWLLIE